VDPGTTFQSYRTLHVSSASGRKRGRTSNNASVKQLWLLSWYWLVTAGSISRKEKGESMLLHTTYDTLNLKSPFLTASQFTKELTGADWGRKLYRAGRLRHRSSLALSNHRLDYLCGGKGEECASERRGSNIFTSPRIAASVRVRTAGKGGKIQLRFQCSRNNVGRFGRLVDLVCCGLRGKKKTAAA